jgi:class 3 adenylate cyclase
MKKGFTLIVCLVLTLVLKAQKSDLPPAFLARLDEAEALYFDEQEKERAFSMLDSLLESPTAQSNSYAEAEILFVYASFENEEGNFVRAIELANAGISNVENTKHQRLLGDLYYTTGVSYDFLGFYAKAIESILIALKISEERMDTIGMITAHTNLAIVQTQLDELSDAKRNYFRSLYLASAIEDSIGVGDNYINIGSFYLLEGNYDSAKYFIRKAIDFAELYDDDIMRLNANGAMSDYYSYLNQMDSTLFYQKISYNLSLESGSFYTIANEQISLASIYLQNKQFEDAQRESLKALEMSLEHGIKGFVAKSYDYLYAIDRAKGNFKDALNYYLLSEMYYDSIRNEEVAKDAVRQQLAFDYDKKEALNQLELERQQRQRNIFITGFLLMSIASGVILVQRNKISKEKNRSESLLLNILPYETAQELKQKGYADSKQIEQVTVLFTDFKGFTELSEKLAPSDLVKNIHECFSAFDQIMEKNNVEKIKTIGDAYMAAGGLPTPNQTNAVDVVKAALEIQEYMANKSLEKAAGGEPYFEIRIGVHTGPVVAGIVGVKKFQYDIWGDTVNTASRMESSGEVGKVNISSFTYSLVKDAFHCEYRGEIEAKGKGKVGMYFVSRKDA